MYVKRYEIELTTATDGAASGLTAEHVSARVVSVQYARPTAAQISATAVITVKTNTTSQTILSQAVGSADFVKVPLQVPHTSAGVAATSALDGGGVPFFVAQEQISAAIASATAAAQTGTVRIFVG